MIVANIAWIVSSLVKMTSKAKEQIENVGIVGELNGSECMPAVELHQQYNYN